MNMKRSGPNSFYIGENDTTSTENEQVDNEQEQEEYTQEAFTPVFTIAPEDIPPPVAPLPTEEEKKSTLEKMYARLGVKAKEVLESEPIPLTPEIEARVNKTSLMVARIFSSISMWGWSIFGVEYQIVAPTVIQSQKMIEPIMRMTARHTPFIGNISPDIDDIIEAGTAISDYALYAMATMQQIREDKLANNGRYTGTYRATTGETRTSNNGIRPDDILRPTTSSNQDNENARDGQYTNTNEHLTAEQQYNRDMLSQLSARDYQARVRRTGRI